MNAPAKMWANPLERLRSALESTPRNHDFLAEYVSELNRYGSGSEENVFRRLAFWGGNSGGMSFLAELYDPLSTEEKTELRRWWHEKIRQEAYRHDDLKTRLSWRYFV